MKKKCLRDSNIELLRICAMLMIILYHIVRHSVKVQIVDTTSIELLGNGLFCQPKFYNELSLLAFVMPMGIVGNVVFILISGYFLAAKEEVINILKISKKLLLQLAFAISILVIASPVLHKVMPELSLKLVSIQSFNKMSWFIGYYFLVVLIGKLFLNQFLAKLTKGQYTTFLVISFAVIQFAWSALLLDNLSSGLNTLCTGVFLYALGGYIRKFEPFQRVRTYVFFVVIVVTNLLVYLSFYNDTETRIANYLHDGSETVFYQSIKLVPNNSIVAILIGVSIFEVFRRIKVPSSRIINYLAQATLMIYLLHDNSFFYSIWSTQDWATLLYSDPATFVWKLLIWTIGVFVIGTIVYTLYKGICGCIPKIQWIFMHQGERKK